MSRQPAVSRLINVRTLGLLWLSIGFTGAALAQTVISVEVGKHAQFVQISATTVQSDPRPLGPNYGGPWGFSADVNGTNVGSLSAPTITGPFNTASIPTSWFNGGKLSFNAANPASLFDTTGGGWRMGQSPNPNDWGSPNKDDLNSKFPDGTYTFSVADNSISLNLTGNFPSTPNKPIVTLSGGAWSNGQYVLDVSQPLTITTNAFTEYGTHVMDAMGAWSGLSGIGQASSEIPGTNLPVVAGTNFLQYTVPAFSFVSGQTYHGGAQFAAIVDVNSVAGLPDSFNFAYLTKETQFLIAAVPEPETYAMLLAGLGLVSFMGRRRKVRAIA